MWDHLRFFSSPAAYRLAATMHGAWSSFIRGEVPNAPGLPAWPAYSVGEQATMIFDETTRVEKGPQAAELQLWQGLMMPPPAPPAVHVSRASKRRHGSAKRRGAAPGQPARQ